MSQCDMVKGCLNAVTHIGEKGYVYCAEHVGCRRGVERCRRMRGWELARIAAGKRLMSYRPITRAQSEQRELERRELERKLLPPIAAAQRRMR